FNKQFPLINTMLSKFSCIQLKNKKLSDYNSCIAGPICISTQFRGQSIFSGLYRAMHALIREEQSSIEVISTLISKNNPVSIRAHQKNGMLILGDFQYNSIEYVILSKLVESSVIKTESVLT